MQACEMGKNPQTKSFTHKHTFGIYLKKLVIFLNQCNLNLKMFNEKSKILIGL